MMRRDVRCLVTGSILLLDVEGDGRADGGVPVETSLIELDAGRFVAEHRWLTHPGGRIGSHATAVHGITDGMVAGCPGFHDVAHEIEAVMRGRTVVGLSVTNDLKMLRKGIPEIDLALGALVDVQKLSYLAPSGRKAMGLENLCLDLGIDTNPEFLPFGDRLRLHGSSVDAWLTGRCLFALVDRLLAAGDWSMIRDAGLRCFIGMSSQHDREGLANRVAESAEGRRP